MLLCIQKVTKNRFGNPVHEFVGDKFCQSGTPETVKNLYIESNPDLKGEFVVRKVERRLKSPLITFTIK